MTQHAKSNAEKVNLRDIYRILTNPLFQFTRYLQDLGSFPLLVYTVFTGSRQPPFSIYMIFTGYRQPLFFNLPDIYRYRQPPFSIYMILTEYRQPPYFNLRGIYRVSSAPPPFSIYAVFTGSRQPPFFNLRGIYNDTYRISTAPLFYFTWYLQGLDSPFFNLRGIYNGISHVFKYFYITICLV